MRLHYLRPSCAVATTDGGGRVRPEVDDHLRQHPDHVLSVRTTR